MKKTIGYIRVSTTMQANDGSSLDNQKDKIVAYAKANGLELSEIISDEGISAYRGSKRNGYDKIMDMIKDKEVDNIIVYSLSRFSRNIISTLQAVEMMNKSSVAFHSISEKIDTSSPQGKFFLTIISALAQMESEMTSVRIKDVKAHNKGLMKRYSKPVYGFHNGQEMVPNKAELPVVQFMFHAKRKGESLHGIANQLNKMGVRSNNNKLFSHKTVQYILNNKIYQPFVS